MKDLWLDTNSMPTGKPVIREIKSSILWHWNQSHRLAICKNVQSLKVIVSDK